jgi:hypothetical protein
MVVNSSFLTAAAVLVFSFSTTNAFVIRPTHLSTRSSSILLSNLQDGSGNLPKRSLFEGNQRPPTEEELKVMDQMIDKLSDAKPYDLPNAVQRAFRVISSPQFFLRIAYRTDQATTDHDREKLAALAANLVSTLDAVVSTTTDKLDDRAKQVQRVVQAAAEPDSGEFFVPLLPERIQAMREEFNALEESSLDEGFLTTVDSWMNKSHADGMDLMVGILQKVLQLYAGKQIGRARARQGGDDKEEAAALLLDELLQTDADAWDGAILATASVDLNQLLVQVARTTESIILSLEAGSMSQRVQAEYLQELMKRIEAMKQQKKL